MFFVDLRLFIKAIAGSFFLSFISFYPSWENVDNMVDNEEIWIAQGTYKPDATDRDISFDIANNGVEIYGGFNGTETLLDQRDFQTNVVVLSGDLLDNDDSVIEFSNTTRDDNSYNVITVNGNDSVFDGLTISGGHANGSVLQNQTGGAIYKTSTIANLSITNCILSNNVSIEGAGAVSSIFGTNGTLTVLNSKFYNNLSRHGTAIYSYTGNNRTVTANVTNSLFYNNVAKDNGATKGFAGSAGWFRAYGTNSTYKCNLVNNTYYNKTQLGTY